MPQRYGLRAGVDGRAVGAHVAEGALPDTALQHVPGQFGGLLVVLLGDAEGQDRLADELLSGEPEELLGEGVAGDDVAEAVAHDDRHLHLVQYGLGR